jgi:periplasmic protein TonB
MSEIGSLNGCLVDGDAESLSRAKRLRRKALVISLGAEAAVIVALLLVPLASPGILPRQFITTPLPPYSGGHARAEHPSQPAPPPHVWEPPTVCLFCPPQINRPQSPASADLNPPDIDGPSGPATEGRGIDGWIGPGITGSIGTGKLPATPPRPADAPKPSQPISRPPEVMQAMLVHSVQPEYPPIPRAMRLSGVVELHAIIARDGTIRDLKVISGNALFIPATIAAVREWRYRPTLLNGQPVEVDTYITVNFILQ